MKTPFVATVAVIAAVVAGVGVQTVRPETNPVVKVSGLDAHETHASASLLGQFRTSITGWLWVRTDLYLHNGVEMRPMTEQEARLGHESEKSADGLDEYLRGTGGELTVIPNQERDFRGVFGDIERAVATYRDMRGHKHASPTSSLPLFRLMTWIDPNFVPAWTTGGAILSWDKTPVGLAKSLAFLEDGLRENPDSVALHTEIGQLLLTKKRDFTAAIAMLEKGRLVSQKWAHHLDDDEKEAATICYRWLVLAYRESHQPARMMAVLQEGLKRFKDDGVLQLLKKRADAGPNSSADPPLPDSVGEDAEPGHEHNHDHDHDHPHE